MEDHIPMRSDRSLLFGRQTSKWSLWDVVFHWNNSTTKARSNGCNINLWLWYNLCNCPDCTIIPPDPRIRLSWLKYQHHQTIVIIVIPSVIVCTLRTNSSCLSSPTILYTLIIRSLPKPIFMVRIKNILLGELEINSRSNLISLAMASFVATDITLRIHTINVY